MRDLMLLLLLGGGCVWALRKPWIGVILWTVVSLMSPHVAFGWSSRSWPVATAVGLCTLVGWAFTRERISPFQGPAAWSLLALTLWMCITLPFSFDLANSLPLWERSMKISLMLFVSLSLLDTRRKLDVFIWVLVVSVGYYGVKGGLFTLLTGGNYRTWGPGGFIGGNNELALALILVIPFMHYLQVQSSSAWVQRGLLASMALCAVAALGTHSRGAFIGVAGMLVYFWWKTDRKLIWGASLLIVGAAVLATMPDHWWTRMESILTYKQDASAMGRVNAWVAAWHIAKDRFFGGGFWVALPWVFEVYAPEGARVAVAHSIYFQMMGEHGFLGLALFLLVGVFTWLNARALMRLAPADDRRDWRRVLGEVVQVSMIGYAITGAFLSMAYFDLPYNVMVIATLALRFARLEALESTRPALGRGRTQPLDDSASSGRAPERSSRGMQGAD